MSAPPTPLEQPIVDGAAAALMPDEVLRVAFVSLYSHKYPSIGESHGLSIVAGVAAELKNPLNLALKVLDLVEYGTEGDDLIVSLVRDYRPRVLAFALNYGTFSVFKRIYPKVCSVLPRDATVIVGGPLATYLYEQLLTNISASIIVIRGEAEEATRALLARERNPVPLRSIPSIAYVNDLGAVEVTNRKLIALKEQPRPYREHLPGILAMGGQVFVEASRGCSWSACTFCLRGLTDVRGMAHEYRTREPDWVVSELRYLKSQGVEQVTFADEDFLGSDMQRAEALATALLEARDEIPKFDASLTVHSVYSRRDSRNQREDRKAILAILASAGLVKGFLGIESCSPSQLKRYAKGHTREESAEAANALRDLGIRVEIGVILFDPLCTLVEIADSLTFMRNNRLASVASGISSELRLQANTGYLRLLEHYEERHHRRLHSAEMDLDTLSYPYEFASEGSQILFSRVQAWNQKLHPLYYPAKSLSRFGTHGALGDEVKSLRLSVAEFRDSTCDAIVSWIDSADAQSGSLNALDAAFGLAGQQLAEGVLLALEDTAMRDHPVVERTVSAARDFVSGQFGPPIEWMNYG